MSNPIMVFGITPDLSRKIDSTHLLCHDRAMFKDEPQNPFVYLSDAVVRDIVRGFLKRSTEETPVVAMMLNHALKWEKKIRTNELDERLLAMRLPRETYDEILRS